MSDRPNLAEAFAPVAPGRGAGLQGLLAPKRGRTAPKPETKDSAGAVTAPSREALQAPPVTAPEAGEDEAPRTPETAEQETAEQETVTTGEREELHPAPAAAPKAAPKAASGPKQGHKPAVRKAAPAVKASETVPGALRNVGVYLPPLLLAEVKDTVYQERTTYADLLIDAFEAVDDADIAAEFAPETTLTGSGMPRRAPRKRGEAGIQIQLRLDGLQVAWLDEKVAEFNAPSRSALVSAVFKLHMQAIRPAGE